MSPLQTYVKISLFFFFSFLFIYLFIFGGNRRQSLLGKGLSRACSALSHGLVVYRRARGRKIRLSFRVLLPSPCDDRAQKAPSWKQRNQAFTRHKTRRHHTRMPCLWPSSLQTIKKKMYFVYEFLGLWCFAVAAQTKGDS